MKSGNHRHLSGKFLYPLLLIVGLLGILYGSTTTTSSRSFVDVRDASNLFKAKPSLVDQLLSQTPAGKISPEVLAETTDGKSASVIVFLADQADLSAAFNIKDHDARGWYVYKTLTQHAQHSQESLKKSLDAQGVSYQSFWVANMIMATGDRNLVERLAARPDVARIDSNKASHGIEDPEIAKSRPVPGTPETAEWGVTNVNAPSLWALGFTGQGMVIGNQDTGMRWSHNAIKPKYRGWNGVTADHNFYWHDSIHSGGGSCGANSLFPCDDQGHGTHTTGTTSGDDGAGNQIGVAPGAKWIGCRNMDQGNGTPATYSECFQFFMAPTDLNGNNPNPALRPHVMNNSWGCPVSEGCTTGAELETVVNNAQAAGIFVVVSAGNSGPNCATVSDPPSFYDASFTVGAFDINNTMASFSSRGPSTFYTPNLLKPNISAPGVTVRSCTRTSDTSFGNLSGTSMAGPHVVGVVALLWSARPQLVRNIAATKAVLQNTANPNVSVTAQTCGGTPSTQIPNNSFGYGRVDVLAAYNAAPTAAASRISGPILDGDGHPVSGTTVTVEGNSRTVRTITDADGFYKFNGLDAGIFYTVTPNRANYSFAPMNRSFSLIADRTDAVFTGTALPPSANPLDSPEFFVRQQYLDFLGREPDQGGLSFWSAQLRDCSGDIQCVNSRRTDIAAQFYITQEFRDSGLFIHDVYQAALARRPEFSEYAVDRRSVIGGPRLETDKAAFVAAFVQRPEFISSYPTNMTAELFVDALIQSALRTSGLDLSSERTNLLALYGDGTNTTNSRSLVLRSVAENTAFQQTQYNRAFVLMEYYGYLGRNPDARGYQFWLDVLNNGDRNNYRGMVCSFITSAEYQRRFSSVVTRNNAECSQ